MKSRPVSAVIAGTALFVTLALVSFAGFALVGDDQQAPVTTSTTTPAAQSSDTTVPPDTTTTSVRLTSTTTTTTTTTLPPVEVTLTIADAPDDLTAAIAALYLWAGAPAEEPQPAMAESLAEHLTGVPRFASLELEGEASLGMIGEERIAVAALEDDVVLAVDGEEGWRIVGAQLSSLGKAAHYGGAVRMVLVIGSDARPGENQQRLRADSLHLLTSVIGEQAGTIAGFPRDSWVETPYGGEDKFTHTMAGRGPAVVLETGRNLTGLPIEGYVVTGFGGFTNLIDAFGGVEVDIPFGMSDEASQAYFRAGLQLLRGAHALAFSRNRHISGGDFTRSFHQGVVIHAGLSAVQARGILELPVLLEMLLAHTWTDLDAESLLTLAAGTYELDPDKVTNFVFPGDVGRAGSKSVVFLREPAEELFRDLEDGLVTLE